MSDASRTRFQAWYDEWCGLLGSRTTEADALQIYQAATAAAESDALERVLAALQEPDSGYHPEYRKGWRDAAHTVRQLRAKK